MKVKKISIANVEVDALPELLDKEKIGFQPIDNVNWEARSEEHTSELQSRE